MLEVGIKAPDFELPDQNGKTHRLSDYTGKKVILYFYPKDNTAGCTKQACGFSERYPQFTENLAPRRVYLNHPFPVGCLYEEIRTIMTFVQMREPALRHHHRACGADVPSGAFRPSGIPLRLLRRGSEVLKS